MSEDVLRKSANDLISVLPASDVQKVITFALNLHKNENNPYRPISEEEMLKDLVISKSQASEGKIMDFDTALQQLDEELVIQNRRKHGVCRSDLS